jgi:hypothetical protein
VAAANAAAEEAADAQAEAEAQTALAKEAMLAAEQACRLEVAAADVAKEEAAKAQAEAELQAALANEAILEAEAAVAKAKEAEAQAAAYRDAGAPPHPPARGVGRNIPGEQRESENSERQCGGRPWWSVL